MSIFETLNKMNVNEHTEGKNGLTYLSWAWAWAEFKKVYPEATYEVVKFDGKPYVYDENLGYMCYTTVTVDGLTHEMWLPVMDGANKAMKAQAYTYKDKWGKEKEVQPANMFDINKTIMRCLTKNLAMFGLGLYIYAGEDLPTDEQEQNTHTVITSAEAKSLEEVLKKKDVNVAKLLEQYKAKDLTALTPAQYADILKRLKG